MNRQDRTRRITELPIAERTQVTFARVGIDLFRVMARDGQILGHVAVLEHQSGERYRAQRYHRPSGRFISLGEFWTASEAVRCLSPSSHLATTRSAVC